MCPRSQRKFTIDIAGKIVKGIGYQSNVCGKNIQDLFLYQGDWTTILTSLFRDGAIISRCDGRFADSKDHGSFDTYWTVDQEFITGEVLQFQKNTRLDQYWGRAEVADAVTGITDKVVSDRISKKLTGRNYNRPEQEIVKIQGSLNSKIILRRDSSLLPATKMQVSEDAKRLIDQVFSIAGELLEPKYWVLPRLADNLDQHVIFLSKGPYATHSVAAYEKIIESGLQSPVHFQIWYDDSDDFSDNQKRSVSGISDFRRFRHRSLSGKVFEDAHFYPPLIMPTNTLANGRKWAGMDSFLEDPKGLAYWEYLLNERPLVATAYIIDPSQDNKVLAVGAKRTFDQLNRKTDGSGQPLILNQSVSTLDEQIAPIRLSAITELLESSRLDTPVTRIREYVDGAIGMTFPFIEEFHRLSNGKILNVVSYRLDEHDKFWINFAETKRRGL